MFMNVVSIPEATLSNGVQMPLLGLGTWKSKDGEEVISAVKYALETGYSHIDTASIYGNETGIGRAIKESGIPRELLFITSKVWNSDQGYYSTLKAFELSINKLETNYLDLYLIHWPVKDKYKETWKALEKLYEEGKVKAIGICNFHIHHLEDLLPGCNVIPMINQVEYHPLLNQKHLLAYCKLNRIQFEAWSPLMQGYLTLPVLEELSDKYRKTPAQIVLRWDIQNGVITIPKSVKPARIIENAGIFDFELSEEDMARLNNMNSNERFGPNPDTFTF